MSEQMFFRNNRWVPRSQLNKKIEIEESKIETKTNSLDLETLKKQQEFLNGLTTDELIEIAKDFSIKKSWLKSREKLVHEIILKQF